MMSYTKPDFSASSYEADCDRRYYEALRLYHSTSRLRFRKRKKLYAEMTRMHYASVKWNGRE